MSRSASHLLSSFQRVFHGVALGLIVVFAVAALGATLLAVFGVIPWLELTVRFGETVLPNAGMYSQIIVTLFAISLCFFIPSAYRVMSLERSHRTFNVSMEDIARAYRESHAADRADTFNIGGEFDSVRDRIDHLRNHPDLGALEPGLLEMAAQMSHESQDLARTYSREKVDRARLFLKQRQEEIAQFQENIAIARQTVDEIKRWLLQVETEEGLVERQLDMLENDLMEVLPQLGFDLAFDDKDQTVVPMGKPDTSKATKH